MGTNCKMINIRIGSSNFKVILVTDDEAVTKGLSDTPKLGSYKGLVLKPSTNFKVITMKNMNYPLDLIFLSDDGEILQLTSFSSNDKGVSTIPDKCKFIIEVNRGVYFREKLKEGDMIALPDEMVERKPEEQENLEVDTFNKGGQIRYSVKEDDVKINEKAVQILDSKGEVIGNFKHGARIFSREHTKKLIASFKEKNFEKLATEYIEFLKIQDND